MSRPKTMHARKMLSLPQDMWKAIDDFRFQHRYKTEADAIRHIVERGLMDDVKPETISALLGVLQDVADRGGLTREEVERVTAALDKYSKAQADAWDGAEPGSLADSQ